MLKSLSGFWRHFRRRRRRFWRYVSPRRRGTALAVLALLSAAVYGYWYHTNSHRIRHLAEAYLRGLTGGHVSIREASFRLFGKVELKDVVVRVPEDNSPYPLFSAEKVVLSHRPWDTLIMGRLQATEINCTGLVVNVVYYDERGDRSNVKLAELTRKKQPSPTKGGEMMLPPIHVQKGKVLAFGGWPRRQQGEMSPLVMSLRQAEKGYCEAVVEQEGKASGRLQFKWCYDLATGKVMRWQAGGPILDVALALPPAYAGWLGTHIKAGNFIARWDGQKDQDAPVEVEVRDVATRLAGETGLPDLENVGGKIFVLKDNRVQIQEFITGRLASPAAGELKVAGYYGGAAEKQPFKITLKVDGMTVPTVAGNVKAEGELAEAVRRIQEVHELYKPSGKVDLNLVLRREPGGGEPVEGTITAKGLFSCYKHFPYPLENIRGDIEFTADTVRFSRLEGAHSRARFTISGWTKVVQGRETYDITIESKNLPMDATLKAAFRPATLAVFNDLAPEGFANVKTRIRKDEGQDEKTTLVFLDGANLTVAHKFFPYRVEITGGCVHIQGDEVVIPGPNRQASGLPTDEQPIQARRSQTKTECLIYGRALHTSTDKPTVDFRIEADNVPLDGALTAALQPQARSALAGLNATGTLRNVKAVLKQSGGTDVDFDVSARLENMSFKYSGFPYAVRDAVCDLRIQPQQVTVKDLTGRHGKTGVEVSGRVLFGQKAGGADLRMEITNLAFDADLLSAVGPAVREVWNQVAPAGTADLTVSKYKENTPEKPGGLDYEVTVKPRDMTLGYTGLPYRFRIGGGAEVTTKPADSKHEPGGFIVATPGRVEIRGLRSTRSQEQASLESLDGTIAYDDKTVDVTLALKASNLPLDARNLEALQKAEFPLAAQLKPGGSFDIDLEQVEVFRSLPAGGSQRGEGQPATRPGSGGSTKVKVSGGVTLRNVIIGFVLGESRASGGLRGSVIQDQKGLAIDGELVDLDLMVGGKRRVHRVDGHLRKQPGKPLQIDEICGEAYGGRLEAQASVALEKPMRYRLRVTFEALRLEELLGRGAGAEGKKPDIVGLVDGSMEMSGTAGNIADRRASGQLRISKAKLAEVPVLLSLLQVTALSLPREGPFVHGFVDYYMKGTTVIFREIHVGGPVGSLVGSGKMDIKTGKLNLTFLSGSGELPRLGSGIEELLQRILSEIAEVRVTGTLEKPVVKTVPLRRVKDIITTLTRPEAAGD